MKTVHTIKKFALELQLEKTTDHYRLQQNAASLVKEKLTTELDNLLTEYFPGDEITQIKKLEINLGSINAEKFDEVFVETCVRQLKARLKELSVQPETLSEFVVTRKEKEENILEQFLYFLQTGNLSWSVLRQDFETWKEQVLNAVVEKKMFFILQYSTLAKKKPEITDRLILQFDDTFLQKLLYACEPSLREELMQLFLHLQGAAVSNRKIKIRKQVLTFLLGSFFKLPAKKLADQVRILNNWFSKQIRPDAYHQPSLSMTEELEEMLKIASLSLPEDRIIQIQKRQQSSSTKNTTEETEIKKETAIEKEDAIFVGNAGLVILHPFLKNLFEVTGLVNNETFISEEARHRAVHLLQYMASGEESLPEYFLPLNKLLCGLTDEEHIDRFVRLAPDEKQEGEKLLSAVIEHWAALRNTSIEGLQQGFLQRRGKLSFITVDEYWKLNVERNAIDILLDKLPWGYSYIQLPWMKHKLITEW